MTGEGLRVDPQDLRNKAVELRSLKFTRAPERSSVTPPDSLPSSITAKANLDANSAALYDFQEHGQREGIRLAETLESVAEAYRQIDEETQAHFDGRGGPPEPVKPKASNLPDPVPPAQLGARQQVGYGGGIVPEAEQKFGVGDGGSSLDLAGEGWQTNATNLRDASVEMKKPVKTWEGAAALEAYRKFRDYGEWLEELATAWDQLAEQAFDFAAAHRKERPVHTDIYHRYTAAETNRDFDAMQSCQHESDDLLVGYAHEVTSPAVQPPNPPESNVPKAAVTRNGTQRATDDPSLTGDGAGQDSGTGSGGGASGGGSPSGATDPNTAQTSPMSADPSQGQSQGEQSGGSGGEQSGGGSPSGGGQSGGMPGLPTSDDPKRGSPSGDPRLAPAAGAGGGGSGGGGAGGGSTPLQPSVAGVAVGPSPSTGTASGGTAAAPAAAASGGMMGGGMGGMPMGGHGGQGGGGAAEKKRTPGLSPDEELYTEDRPHTEGIIGRPERRAGQGKRDST